jgi:hypothetical protein
MPFDPQPFPERQFGRAKVLDHQADSPVQLGDELEVAVNDLEAGDVEFEKLFAVVFRWGFGFVFVFRVRVGELFGLFKLLLKGCIAGEKDFVDVLRGMARARDQKRFPNRL